MRIIHHTTRVMAGHKTFFLVEIDHKAIDGVGLYDALVEIDTIGIFWSRAPFIPMRVMAGITANGLHKMALTDLGVDVGDTIDFVALKTEGEICLYKWRPAFT